MNIRKLMARLNAMSQNFAPGSGGIPEFTPQDLAAAVGMVDDVIGREIFCLAWWPDGARLVRRELHQMIRNLLLTEFSSRYAQREDARLRLHLLTGSKPELRSRAVEKLKGEVQAKEKALWPCNMEKYDMIAEAVFLEICAPRHCQNCKGRGHVIGDALVVKCETCKGTGIVGANKSWRARCLEIDESTYRRYWSRVYEWVFDAVSARESSAAHRIVEALGYAKQAA